MNDPYDMDLNPPIPQWALEMQARAVELRRQGWSYEAIAEEVSDDAHGETPWLVYKWCNPEKSPQQIAAWAKKHHPNPEEWSVRYLAKHHPEVLQRETDYEEARQKGESLRRELAELAVDMERTER